MSTNAKEGLVTPAFDCREHSPQLAVLARRYAAATPISPTSARFA